MKKISVFFISDGTGITVETLGSSLITQFEGAEFNTCTIPYVNTHERAQEVVAQINQHFTEKNERPLVLTTLADPQIRHVIDTANAKVMDFFQTFIPPMEIEFDLKASTRVGKSHSASNRKSYEARIDAMNFALACDDGVGIQHYNEADVILIGVSRCGKTPTSIYLAMHFGVFAANYPLTDEELQTHQLPSVLRPFKNKLFGLTIDCDRLQTIRSERRANSQYSSREQCLRELQEIEGIYRQENIAYLNTTFSSVEEISTKIMIAIELDRHLL